MKSIYSGKVKWTDKEYGKEFTTLDMWVLTPQWRSKDTCTLSQCHKCTRSPAIHHLVISARLDTAGPGWTRAKPANQSLDHVASVQTLKATKLCAMYCLRDVLSQSRADWVSELPSNVTSCRYCQSLSLHLFIMSHCLIALDRDNGMHGWRSINSL